MRFDARYLEVARGEQQAQSNYKKYTYRWSKGRFAMVKDVGHDEWDGAIFETMWENLQRHEKPKVDAKT
jgi:hypothetical protein